jgi:hypothetical protein
MENHLLVTPLYGAGASGALSTLLDVHGVRFLLDCGWDDAYDPALLAPLIQVSCSYCGLWAVIIDCIIFGICMTVTFIYVNPIFPSLADCSLSLSLSASLFLFLSPSVSLIYLYVSLGVFGGQVLPSIDAVLISHPDSAHLGALPYLVGRHGLRAPIYATSALQKMGQMFLYDQYLSHHATSDFNLFTLDDVDEAFRLIICLKYHQNTQLTGEAPADDTPTPPAFPALNTSLREPAHGMFFGHQTATANTSIQAYIRIANQYLSVVW